MTGKHLQEHIVFITIFWTLTICLELHGEIKSYAFFLATKIAPNVLFDFQYLLILEGTFNEILYIIVAP